MNITVANSINGQITTKLIEGDKIPEDLIRDGWVEVHREAPPNIIVIVEGGAATTALIDRPGAAVKVVDLDLAENPSQVTRRLKMQSAGLFEFDLKK